MSTFKILDSPFDTVSTVNLPRRLIFSILLEYFSVHRILSALRPALKYTHCRYYEILIHNDPVPPLCRRMTTEQRGERGAHALPQLSCCPSLSVLGQAIRVVGVRLVPFIELVEGDEALAFLAGALPRHLHEQPRYLFLVELDAQLPHEELDLLRRQCPVLARIHLLEYLLHLLVQCWRWSLQPRVRAPVCLLHAFRDRLLDRLAEPVELLPEPVALLYGLDEPHVVDVVGALGIVARHQRQHLFVGELQPHKVHPL